MRTLHVVLTLGALASAASATTLPHPTPVEPIPTVHLAEPDRVAVDHADLSLASEEGELRGTLRLVLSTTDPERSDRSILIAVPRGTEIRTLAVTIDEERLEAVLATAGGARRAYENTVERMTDPALLEWVRATSTQTWLRLRVFPVTPRSPATVRLGLGLPVTTRVAIDPGTARVDHVTIAVDDESREWFELDAPFGLAVAATTTSARIGSRPPFVRAGVSLVAGPTVIAGREACPDGEVCLRMTYRRVALPPVRALHPRSTAHRMRLPARMRALAVRLAGT